MPCHPPHCSTRGIRGSSSPLRCFSAQSIFWSNRAGAAFGPVATSRWDPMALSATGHRPCRIICRRRPSAASHATDTSATSLLLSPSSPSPP
eukprot:12921631-Heterocapsa_arctica.AAC.1